jgi:flagellin-like protein
MKIQNEEAVSPVIGVILMVAITVILAAVIAAFVFGMAGSTGTSKSVGLTVSLLPEYATGESRAAITINGGTDIPTLHELKYSNDGGANWYDVSALSGGTSSAVGEFTVGRIVYTTHNVKTEFPLQIKGIFDDGSEQILFTRSF